MPEKLMKKMRIILFVAVIILLSGSLFYLPVWLNNKITSYINQNTEFEFDISIISFTGYRSLTLKNITLRHKLDKQAYFKSKGFQTDWIAGKVVSVSIYGISWRKLLFDKKFYADKVLIFSPDICIFRDKRIPSLYVYKALPAALLRGSKISFTIPIVEIKDGKVVYEETVEKTQQNITIPFNHLYATCYHISSDSLYLSEQPVVTIDTQAMIFDSVETAVTYISNTLNSNNVFTLEGNIKSFSPSLMNPYIAAATHVIVEDGRINSIHFKLIADENVANGTVRMDYKQLKLKVLKTNKQNKDEPGEEKTKKSVLKTFLANLFVRDNDKKQHDAKELPFNTPLVYQYTGSIHFERRKDRSIFNYWWNSFKSGIISTAVKVPVEKAQK